MLACNALSVLGLPLAYYLLTFQTNFFYLLVLGIPLPVY